MSVIAQKSPKMAVNYQKCQISNALTCVSKFAQFEIPLAESKLYNNSFNSINSPFMF